MSDEKRNISDINDQKTAEQQAFSEEIRRRLAEPGSGKPTLDEFKVMVYKDREKRRKKRNALVACIVAAFIVGCLTYDDLVPEVGADKNPKETIQTEDGVIIEDGGWGSSTGDGWTITNEEDIVQAKEMYPQIKMPKYMPKGFEFDKLTITNVVDNNISCKYRYFNKENRTIEIEMVFVQDGEVSLSVDEPYNEITCSKGTLYFQKIEGNNKKATILIDDGIIMSVWYDIATKHIVEIVDGII